MIDVVSASDTVLDETPARALKLLGAIGTNPYIRAILEKRGYCDEVNERGWKLLLRAVGYAQPASPDAPKSPAALAIAELDAWDEPNFAVASAALSGEFPDQAAFLFRELAPSTGAGAVVSVTLFLDRLDELESGSGRKATRKADVAALEKLSERGITKQERARLSKLLEQTRLAPELPKAAPEDEKTAKARREAKVALRAFYAEWAGIAKADIRRRDYLIQLGLAKRKARKEATSAEAPSPAAAKA